MKETLIILSIVKVAQIVRCKSPSLKYMKEMSAKIWNALVSFFWEEQILYRKHKKAVQKLDNVCLLNSFF